MTDDRQLARVLYIAHAFSLVFSLGLLSVLPLIANYLKRPETAGGFVYSHHTWMIRTFWIYTGCVLGTLVLALTVLHARPFLFVALLGLVFMGAWVWKAYRLVRGFLELDAGRAIS